MQDIAAIALVFISLTMMIFLLLTRFPSFKPFIGWLAGINSGLPLKTYQRFYEEKLLFKGQENAADFNEFMAVKELLFTGAFLVFGIMLSLPIGISFLIAIVFFFLPDIKLQDRLKKRQEALRRAFVPFLDLISLILESGLDFIQGLNYLAIRFPAGEFTCEIEKVLLEIKLGSTREKALLRFADRTLDKDIRDFVSAVISSEKSGSSLAKTLKGLSTTVKTARIQRAEKAAHEAPVKLLGPLVGFIFPVVFVVLFGPIIISFLK